MHLGDESQEELSCCYRIGRSMDAIPNTIVIPLSKTTVYSNFTIVVCFLQSLDYVVDQSLDSHNHPSLFAPRDHNERQRFIYTSPFKSRVSTHVGVLPSPHRLFARTIVIQDPNLSDSVLGPPKPQRCP